jgi:putative DNA primase/helicase
VIDLNVVEAGPVRYDLEEIVRRLRATAHVWVPELFPHGRRQGDEWRLANIQGAPPRRSGSCVIMLRGEHAGDWHDFDGGDGGGPLSTLAHGTGLSDRALFAHAAGMTGWTCEAPARREPAQPPRAERDPQREIEHILSGAVPIVGTAAEAYLRGRGLSAPPDPDLLFHPDLTHWETRRGVEAMLGVVRDRAGSIVALHRTYLEVDAADPTRVTKARVSKPRMLLGRPAGGAVRLAPLTSAGVLGICEGIETGLAVMAACEGLPVWAALSTAGIEQVQLPPETRRVVILADNDVSGAGLRAAEAAAAKLRLEGREVAIALPPDHGDDFNDMLRRHGPDAIAALVDASMRSGSGAPRQPPQPAAIGRHVPMGFVEPSGQMPMMRADDGDLKRATRMAWDLLYTSNVSPWLFLVGGHPNWVVPDDDGRPVPVAVRDERLRYMLARIARWCRINPKGEAIPVPPPADVVKNLLATPNPALPVLSGIVTAPAFGRSGVLLTTAGYHPDARLLYHPMPGFVLGSVAERPTADAIAAARSLLLDDLLGDFPFVGTAERAHALALLLLGFVRAMIDGPTPLHLIEKPTPGTGATLMVDAIATVLTGAGAPVMTEGRDEDEWRKRLTAKLRQLPPLLLIDNLRQELDSSALAAALTAPIWEDRVLGGSNMVRLPIRCVWVATGNNPSFSNEIARRLVRIRLDARVEQPWRRDGFRHPSLIGWVQANRGALVAACLTLCQAWIAAGRPRGTRSIGSFEAWSQVIGGILEVAGVDGFLANLDEVMQASDKEGSAWSGFVQTWWDRFGSADVSVSDLVGFAQAAEPALPISTKADHGMRVALGMALRKLRDRAFRVGERLVHLRSAGMVHNSQRWRLEPSADPREGGLGASRGDFAEKSPTAEAQGNPRVGGTWRTWGTFSDPYACARACAREIGTEKDPQVPQVPQISGNAWVCGGGTSGGLHSGPPKDSQQPHWLDGVP